MSKITCNNKKADQIGKIDIMFSSNEDYLSKVWVGMPGVETVDYSIDLKEYGSIVVFCDEIQKDYIKNCDGTIGRTVFQNFAQKIVDSKKDYNCTNVCIPIWFEPITNTIDHDIGMETCDFREQVIRKKVT